MMDIPEFIKNLTDNDLRKELKKFDIVTGPITPTTKRLLQRKLTRSLGIQVSERKKSEENKECVSVTTQTPVKLDSKKSAHGSATEPEKLFYGVFLPKNDEENEKNEPIVFESKSSTLLLMKEHKNARFKVFDTHEQAEEYSLKGTEEKIAKSSPSNAPETTENANNFPSLKQEDLNKLMRFIESGDVGQVKTLVWSNPKYLISSADGPVVLKASARYNSLHIAAKSNKPKICNVILSTIENNDFQGLMFPNTTDEIVSKQRTEHLIDSYLNTPEKILFETPLHFACKLGYKNVVAELIAYSQCQTTAKNKFGQTPFDIICSRATPHFKSNKEEIESLLSDQYYVPLLRYQDNSEHAIIGTPITTKQRPEDYAATSPLLRNHSFGYASEKDSPLAPTLTVSALAGPMQKRKALEFKKCWTTPSKHKNLLSRDAMYLRRADSEKGDEHIGRQLAEKENIGWVEYWEFLSDFANFASGEGLGKLENFLRDRMPYSSALKETESMSKNISDLTDMLEKVHLNQEFSTQTRDVQPAENHSTPDKSYFPSKTLFRSTPEKFSESSRSTNSSDSYSKYKTPPESCRDDGTKSKIVTFENSGCIEDTATNLVKKLFTPEKSSDKEQSMNTLVNNFPKSLNFDTKGDNLKTNGIVIHGNNAVESQQTTLQYRSISESCSSDVFSSPSVSDLSGSSSTTESRPNIFLAGNNPTKIDRDVLIAIGSTDIDATKYPCVFHWKSSVGMFSENERNKWATPRKARVFSFNPEQSISTPVRSPNVNTSLTPSSGRFDGLSFTPEHNMRRYLYRSFKLSNVE